MVTHGVCDGVYAREIIITVAVTLIVTMTMTLQNTRKLFVHVLQISVFKRTDKQKLTKTLTHTSTRKQNLKTKANKSVDAHMHT